MRQLSSIQEKILDRTLYLIALEGSSNVSIRAIAKEAEVNVSAINYYFRTKEEMLKLVKDFYLDNTREAYAPLMNQDLSAEERLIETANEIMEYTLRYPGVMTILKEAYKDRYLDPKAEEIVTVTEEMNGSLNDMLFKVIDCDLEQQSFKRSIFFSSILYPALYKGISPIALMDLTSKESRLEYITQLINMLKMN